MHSTVPLRVALGVAVVATLGCAAPKHGAAHPAQQDAIVGVAIFYDEDGTEHRPQEAPHEPMPMHVYLDVHEPDGSQGFDVSTGRDYPTHTDTWANPYTWHLAWEHGYLAKAELHATIDHAEPGQYLECHFEDIHGEPLSRAAYPQAFAEDERGKTGGRLDVYCVYSPAA